MRLLAFLALALAPTFPVQAWALSNDLTLSLGGIPSQSRSFRSPSGGSVQISAEVSLGANYGHRLQDAEFAAIYGEFVALPNRSLTAPTATVPQTYASLYVTPGLRLKVLPAARHSPWAALGGGYALYEQSAKLSKGQNTTSKFLNRGVFDFGGGLDYRLFRFFDLRGEVRDFCIRQSKSECGTVLEYAAQHRGQRRH